MDFLEQPDFAESFSQKTNAESKFLVDNQTKNTLRYELYLPSIEKDLANKIDEYQLFVERHLSLNINLNLKISKDAKTGLGFLSGAKSFDHRIEEEWLLIYILFEISKSDSKLVTRVYDDDGSILLIEAAEFLPPWMESKLSERRAFIYKGRLHIIPNNIRIDEKSVNLHECAELIRRQVIDTKADIRVQKAIKSKLFGMPDTQKWLQKRMELLDEVICDENDLISENNGQSFKTASQTVLTLDRIASMNEDELETTSDTTDSDNDTEFNDMSPSFRIQSDSDESLCIGKRESSISTRRDEKMVEYMEAMDAELESTEVRK